jgi:hypothetical protein
MNSCRRESDKKSDELCESFRNTTTLNIGAEYCEGLGMPASKNKNFPITLTDEAIIALKTLGYVDGNRRRVKNKNFSRLVSELVVDLAGRKIDRKVLKKNLLLFRMSQLYREEDRLEEQKKLRGPLNYLEDDLDERE